MSQSLDRLVYMVNQIAREFASQRPAEAAEATWDHVWHFWDPRMREMIIAHLEAGGGEGLSDIARAAIHKLAESHGEPRSVTRATKFGGPDDSRMSDAG
jgi:formate dehydrogenase subunit delta